MKKEPEINKHVSNRTDVFRTSHSTHSGFITISKIIVLIAPVTRTHKYTKRQNAARLVLDRSDTLGLKSLSCI